MKAKDRFRDYTEEDFKEIKEKLGKIAGLQGQRVRNLTNKHKKKLPTNKIFQKNNVN